MLSFLTLVALARAVSRTNCRMVLVAALGLAVLVSALPAAQGAFDANRAALQLESERVFPLEHCHDHVSTIVEPTSWRSRVCCIDAVHHI
jgi:hypothetical protein